MLRIYSYFSPVFINPSFPDQSEPLRHSAGVFNYPTTLYIFQPLFFSGQISEQMTFVLTHVGAYSSK